MSNHDTGVFNSNGTIYSKRKQIQPFSTPPLEAYASVAGEENITKLVELARSLEGLKFLSINASAEGGGVAELLYSAMPFLNSIGIDAEWNVIPGNEEFFECTKTLHNMLQGKKVPFTPEMEQIYINNMEKFARNGIIDYEPELVLVHDPQPLGLARQLKKQGQKCDLPNCRHLKMRLSRFSFLLFSGGVSLWNSWARHKTPASLCIMNIKVQAARCGGLLTLSLTMTW